MKCRYVGFAALASAIVLMQIAGCGAPAGSPPTNAAASSGAPPQPSGSSASSTSPPSQSDTAKLTSARAVLDKMAEAYRNAPSYEDFGTASYFEEGSEKPVRADFQVAFQRPNKLRMKFYQGELTCDGKKWFGFSKDIPDQAVLRDAPEKLKMSMLIADSALGRALNDGFFGGSPQLLLLLEEQPLDIMLAGVRDQDVTLEESARLGDYDCYRVCFRRAEGAGEYWIDQKSFVLRHMEFQAAPPPGAKAKRPAAECILKRTSSAHGWEERSRRRPSRLKCRKTSSVIAR